MTSHSEAIRRVQDGLNHFTISSLLEACRNDGIPTTLDELVFIATQLGEEVGLIPSEVTEFVARILEPFAPKQMLDPSAAAGCLAISLNDSLSPKGYQAYSHQEHWSGIWRQLEVAKEISFHKEKALAGLILSRDKFDAVVSCPRWFQEANATLSVEVDGQKIEVKDDYVSVLMLACCQHLTPSGIGIFILSDSSFFESGRAGGARHTLAMMGIRPTAAIELAVGTISSETSRSSHIVILERAESANLFTGRFSSNVKHQQALLENLRGRIEGKSPELGRFVETEFFRGFTPIELSERVNKTAKRIGLIAYAFKDVVAELNASSEWKDLEGFDEKPNAVYLPQMAFTAATTDQGQLPEKLKSYFQLVVNPDVAEAEFLAELMNTSFGQLWRDSLRTGTTIPRIGKASLKGAKIFLPPIESRDIQGKVIDCQRQLTRLRSEINELELQLWQRPIAVNKLEAAIQTINREDRYEDWLDSLPFPLASVLWSCHTQSGSLKEQFERKIHFFEALSEFLGIIFLSAFSANEAIWAEQQKTLAAALSKGRLSLEKATFGTWKAVVELFSKYGRGLLGEQQELVFELFKTRNRDVLDALMSKKLVSVFQATNKIRNDWQGHTGIVPDRDAKYVNDMLSQHIQTVRETFGVAWVGYELLLPGNCKLRDGVFQFSTKKVMGTRTPFPIESVSVSEPMEDGHLYLKSPEEGRGLKLLPLIKIMPSPRTEENACYFYNRCQSDGIRFLSYYFEANAEVVDEFGDVVSALGNLISAKEETN